jgi:hypothetical protein
MTDRDKDILTMMNDPRISMDAFSFMLGEKLGEGQTRAVYDFALDSNYVVKIAKKFPNDNILEFEIWNLLKGKEIPESKWLAECRWLSPSGHLLLQRKTTPIKELPTILPNIFTDIHINNFGKIGNRVVCHDYAHSIIRYIYLTKFKMVKWENSLK